MAARPLLLACLAALVGALIFAATAAACSCAGPAPGEEKSFYREALQRSDGAFVGKLLRKRPVGNAEFPTKAIYVYRVTRAFKAEQRLADRTVRVRSAADGAACGIEQRIGTRGGLFLYRSGGRWSSNLCLQVSPRDLRRAARSRDGDSRRVSGEPCGSAAAAA
jgi:hypothetical protein